MNNKFKLLITAIALLGAVGPLSSCGGGGGGGGSTAPVAPLGFANGEAAVVVVGQADFISKVSAGGATGLNSPYSNAHVSGGKLYISDYGNNRVMVYNNIPTSDGASADYALGQPDRTTVTSGTSATTMAGPLTSLIALDSSAERVYCRRPHWNGFSPAADRALKSASWYSS
jgi:hypothetical protein